MPTEQDTTTPDQTRPSKSRVENIRQRRQQMYKKNDIVRGTCQELDYDSQKMQPKQVSFTICEHLGTGGMGAVYKVTNHRGIRALKLMNPEDMTNAETLQRFKNETKAAISIKHRNVVRIFLQGETEHGQPFMLMEYVDGQTLGALIAARRTKDNILLKPPLAILEAIEIFEQLAGGLSAAHKEQVIHRDIKPGNIMLTMPDQQPADGIFEQSLETSDEAYPLVLFLIAEKQRYDAPKATVDAAYYEFANWFEINQYLKLSNDQQQNLIYPTVRTAGIFLKRKDYARARDLFSVAIKLNSVQPSTSNQRLLQSELLADLGQVDSCLFDYDGATLAFEEAVKGVKNKCRRLPFPICDDYREICEAQIRMFVKKGDYFQAIKLNENLVPLGSGWNGVCDYNPRIIQSR